MYIIITLNVGKASSRLVLNNSFFSLSLTNSLQKTISVVIATTGSGPSDDSIRILFRACKVKMGAVTAIFVCLPSRICLVVV